MLTFLFFSPTEGPCCHACNLIQPNENVTCAVDSDCRAESKCEYPFIFYFSLFPISKGTHTAYFGTSTYNINQKAYDPLCDTLFTYQISLSINVNI